MHHENVSDTWERGTPYDRYMGRWSRRVAPRFLAWLNVPSGLRWLDVGCGTGALCAAILDACAPASVIGIEPSEGFLETAEEHLAGRVTLHRASASSIPLDAAAVDVVVSGLVLNFIPDRHAALLEMTRVTAPGGTIAAYVWDYGGTMDLMRYFWDAAAEIDPEAATMNEGLRHSSSRPEALQELFDDAGLEGCSVYAIDLPMPFQHFDDYWQPFLGGQGTAPAYTMSLDERTRERIRERLRARLPTGPHGSISLVARAWAVRGGIPR